jgi:hypothetical protein
VPITRRARPSELRSAILPRLRVREQVALPQGDAPGVDGSGQPLARLLQPRDHLLALGLQRNLGAHVDHLHHARRPAAESQLVAADAHVKHRAVLAAVAPDAGHVGAAVLLHLADHGLHRRHLCGRPDLRQAHLQQLVARSRSGAPWPR